MRKIIFYFGYIIGSKRVLKNYKNSLKLRNKSPKYIEKYQFKKLKSYLIDAYENTNYYKECFDNINFNPYNFNDLSEMKNIPILTKKIINERKSDFYSNKKNIKFKVSRSGGSTGEPFEFRLGLDDAAWSRALLFNGFNYAGYNLGDSITTIAGGSLVKPKITLKQKVMNFILNTETIGTLHLKDKDYLDIIEKLNKRKPKFIRGYASSIYRLAKYIDDNDIKLNFSPKGLFTTSETIEDYQRLVIENVFNAELFDQYGLNDSGASAFQYAPKKYLIDYERSFIELLEEEENHRIISTSYSNDAMYFIRYDTGDSLLLTDEEILNKKVASKILGRTSELLSMNGVDVSVPRLTILLADLSIERYQIIKKNNVININYTGELIEKDKKFIDDLFTNLFGEVNIVFNKIDDTEFILTRNGKHKYFIEQ